MAVPKPHGGPTADKDRSWNWSEQGAELVDGRLQVVWHHYRQFDEEPPKAP